MENFYFTFGTDKSQPFYGGWIIVKAKNMREAALIFKMYFPNLRHPEFCNLCWYLFRTRLPRNRNV